MSQDKPDPAETESRQSEVSSPDLPLSKGEVQDYVLGLEAQARGREASDDTVRAQAVAEGGAAVVSGRAGVADRYGRIAEMLQVSEDPTVALHKGLADIRLQADRGGAEGERLSGAIMEILNAIEEPKETRNKLVDLPKPVVETAGVSSSQTADQVEAAQQRIEQLTERERLLENIGKMSIGTVGMTESLQGSIARKLGEEIARRTQENGRSFETKAITVGFNTYREDSSRVQSVGIDGAGPAPEGVSFITLTEPIYEERERDRMVGGRFSRHTEVEKYKVKSGERPLIHNELVAGGSPEPAVHIQYEIRGRGLPGFIVGGRDGRPNSLQVDFDLPQSLAEELREKVVQDPGLIRAVVEKQLLDFGVPREMWEGGPDEDHRAIRPPYESCPPDHKLQVYAAGSGRGAVRERVDVPFSS